MCSYFIDSVSCFAGAAWLSRALGANPQKTEHAAFKKIKDPEHRARVTFLS
jgi:hypothetical protein